jgi:hypothetical protein
MANERINWTVEPMAYKCIFDGRIQYFSEGALEAS